MPRFAKLDPVRVGLLKQLFQGDVETVDLVIAFQKWEVEDIELSPTQIRRTLEGIRTRALPPAQAFAWRSPTGPLREDAEGVVEEWRSLEATFVGALKDERATPLVELKCPFCAHVLFRLGALAPGVQGVARGSQPVEHDDEGYFTACPGCARRVAMEQTSTATGAGFRIAARQRAM